MRFPKNDPFLQETRRQFVQNLVFFSGIVFSQQFFSPIALMTAMVGYGTMTYLTVFTRGLTFSLAAGHTLPHSEVVAHFQRGARSKPFWILAAFLLVMNLVFGGPYFMAVLLALAIGAIHDLFCRHEALLDVFTIAFEFVAKAVAGALILNLPPSPWLVICAFLLAMLISIGQRRNEIHLVEEELRRPVLMHYSPRLLDQMLAVAASASLVSYSLYTIDERTTAHLGTTLMVYTIPFVLYGVLRYLYLVYMRNVSEGIERYLLHDLPLKACIGAWMGLVFLFVYGGR